MNRRHLKRPCQILLLVMFCFLFLSGCSRKNTQEENYLGGIGQIQYRERLNGGNALYDDENKYFRYYNNIYLKLDKNNILSVNCDIASCSHRDESCSAYVREGEYFVFNNTLYKQYNTMRLVEANMEYNGFIMDCEQDKIVFENHVPAGMDEDKKVGESNEIYYVRVLSDDILKVDSHGYVYLLDREFNIVYWHDDYGHFPWGKIYENKYYYVNDLHQLMCVDMETQECSALATKSKLLGYDDDGDEYIYYTNEYSELYKYNIKDETTVKISDNVVFFAIYDQYIYCNSEEGKFIIDTEGNFVADYSAYEGMGADNIIKIGDKMYTVFDDGLAEMTADGKNYRVYGIE